MRFLGRLARGWRYGEPVVVVSGLPRSGTSMLMAMLEAGGMPLHTDGVRAPDEDNPRGYFELEDVKGLGEQADKAWVRQARGRAIKVISHLLKELPPDNRYQVIFATRHLAEVVASQNRMLANRAEPNPVADAKALALYRQHLVNVRVFLRLQPNFSFLEVAHQDAVNRPRVVAARIAGWLGRDLNVAAMAAVVDQRLYRNRLDPAAGMAGVRPASPAPPSARTAS